MNVKPKGVVTLPRAMRKGLLILPWAKEVNRALQQLRDRIVTVPSQARSTAAVALPLTLKQGTAVDKFQVIPGYVNGVMPTLGGVAINSPVSPATTPATPEITVTADVWVWLKCVGTFGAPDSYVVTIETSSTDTAPAGTAITATGFVSFYKIGDVAVDTAPDPDTYTITNQHGGGNLGVDSWGLYNLWWRA